MKIVVHSHSALIICTRNRAEILAEQFTWFATKMISMPKYVIIVDSSESSASEIEVDRFASQMPQIQVVYVRSELGLPHQRNMGLEAVRKLADQSRVRHVHFLDDDIYPSPSYFLEGVRLLMGEPQASCIGGFDSDLPPYKPNYLAVKCGLMPQKSGTLTRAGFTVVPYPLGQLDRVDWVPGGMQNFNWSILEHCLFDGRYRMYGEDVEMHLRTNKYGPVYVSANLPVVHRKSQEVKDSKAVSASYYSGFRWWLAVRYPNSFSKAQVLLGSLVLFTFNLVIGTLKFDKTRLSSAFGELLFLNRLIKGGSPRPLMPHSGSGPKG